MVGKVWASAHIAIAIVPHCGTISFEIAYFIVSGSVGNCPFTNPNFIMTILLLTKAARLGSLAAEKCCFSAA
jgi:hypothetical protein